MDTDRLHGQQGGALPGARYRYYALAVLTIVYLLSFLDRCLIALFLQPIKQDLKLSDTELGLLTGIAFAIFYAVLGVPVARMADRGDRVTITSVAIALWGVTVMLTGFAGNFLHLVAARVAAAVGEAGCMPPSYSLVGDYFPESQERSRAMSFYMLASPLSALISFILGGWLYGHVGWRFTFVIVGIPAFLISVVVKVTLREPRRIATTVISRPMPVPLLVVVASIVRRRTVRHLCIAMVLLLMMVLGLAPWYAAFMMRSHHVSTQQLGLQLGLVFGLGGAVGTLLGGYAVAKYFGQRDAKQLAVCGGLTAALFPFFVLFLLVSSERCALAALSLITLAFSAVLGPTFALLQRLVADDARATTLALVMLVANLIGMGLGPLSVGVMSDLLEPILKADSLRYSMLSVSTVALLAAFHFWRASRSLSAAQDHEYVYAH